MVIAAILIGSNPSVLSFSEKQVIIIEQKLPDMKLNYEAFKKEQREQLATDFAHLRGEIIADKEDFNTADYVLFQKSEQERKVDYMTSKYYPY